MKRSVDTKSGQKPWARRSTAERNVDILADVRLPHPIGVEPKLPFRVLSTLHSTARHKEWFDLTVLAPFGEQVGHAMVASFLRWIASRSVRTARTKLAGIRRMYAPIAAAFDSGWGPGDWQLKVSLAADIIRNDTSIGAVTQNQYIANSNLFTSHLQHEGIIPAFRLPDGVTNAFLSSVPKRSVSEIAPRSGNHDVLPAGVEEADQEVRDLWTHLSKHTDILDPVVLHVRLVSLLKHIRSVAECGIRQHQHLHAQAVASIDRRQYERVRRWLDRNQGRSNRSLGSGKGSISVFESEAVILSFIEFEYGGMLPTRHEDPSFVRLVYNRFSCKKIAYKMHLTARAAIYYLIIILLDTAMNISSALSVKIHYFEQIGEAGAHRITWYKDRAHDDPIYDYFQRGDDAALGLGSELRIGVINVLECLRSLQKRLQPFALASESENLFLVGSFKGPNGSQGEYRVGTLTETLENKTWDRIRREDPILAEFPITLDQIRTSVLLLDALETNNDLVRVNARAKHKSYRTTARYLRRVATATVNAALAREVQDFMFASGTVNLPDVREAMGMSRERAALIIANARRKGFGTWTGQQERSTDEDQESELTADSALEEWLTSGENLLLADPTVAAEIITFREHLLDQSNSLRSLPSWAETWALILLFLNIALETMPPRVRAEGEQRAEELELFYADLD